MRRLKLMNLGILKTFLRFFEKELSEKYGSCARRIVRRNDCKYIEYFKIGEYNVQIEIISLFLLMIRVKSFVGTGEIEIINAYRKTKKRLHICLHGTMGMPCALVSFCSDKNNAIWPRANKLE